MKIAQRNGFTLIELLVVIAIIGLLMGLSFPVLSDCLSKGRLVSEQSCARSLMIGVYNYSLENDDRIIPGYHNEPTTGPDGALLPFPASARYPWRLMPYIGGADLRVMWAIQSAGTKRITAGSSEAYAVSISPTFGMNVFFAGGDDSGLSGQGIKPTDKNFDTFGKFCLTQMSEAYAPSRQIVFVSARMTGEKNKTVAGYYMVQAPNVASKLWSSEPFSEKSAPANYGFVDFRYGGKAVTAHLDGHVEMLGEADLRDMRRWSNLAAIADDPDGRLSRK